MKNEKAMSSDTEFLTDEETEESPENEKKKLILSIVLFFLIFIGERLIKLPFLQNRIVSTICYLIPALIAGADVFREALEGFLHKEFFGEEFLMVLASIGAFICGETAEAAAVLIFYTLGEYLQDLAVDRSRDSIRALMDITPAFANLWNEKTGTADQVDPSDLQTGDTILVLPGERIPVDGTVLSGSSFIDTSAMTGESVPVSAEPGDSVISGCINLNSLLRIRVDKLYSDSTVSRVMQLTEEAAERKAPTERFITKFSHVYTPVVVFAALLLFLLPPLFTGSSAWIWLKRACTFLVISCPCALVISIPLSFFGGIGAASRKGILVKGSNYLEALTHVSVFVSDKTGTLTEGVFEVTDYFDAAGRKTENPQEIREILTLAALSETASGHPIAESIRRAAQKEMLPLSAPENSEYLPGYGMKVFCGGKELLCGNAKLLTDRGISVPECEGSGTLLYIAENGNFRGSLLISDRIKQDAAEALSELRDLGVEKTVLLTGDSSAAAENVKQLLGIDTVFSGLLPQDKVEKAEALKKELPPEKKLLYAGDGINDAPVLAISDIGISMGCLGSDAAIEAADIVIMDDQLRKIPEVLRIAGKTVRIARQNIVFALSIKLLFLLLGAFGKTTMWMAVFADVGVALLCVLNSMRMLHDTGASGSLKQQH